MTHSQAALIYSLSLILHASAWRCGNEDFDGSILHQMEAEGRPPCKG